MADETAFQLTRQLEYAASKTVPDLTSTRVDTNNPKALRAAIITSLQTDPKPERTAGIGGGKFSNYLRCRHH